MKLPMTNPKRGQITYLKLLRRVHRDAQDGFGWEGKLLQTGQRIDEQELWPAPDYPVNPVVLECAGPAKRFPRERPTPYLFVLWRYEAQRLEFLEVARAIAAYGEWAVELRDTARMLIAGEAGEAPDLDQVRERVSWLLEQELDTLEGPARRAVLSVMHDELAARMVAA